MLENMPAELRALRQWVVWRIEDNGRGKPTKVPYQAHSLQKASSVDAAHWASFDEALTTYRKGLASGVGFVFTEDDPYCGIDLDATDDAGYIETQKRIFEAIPSYAERSPSGNGLHIICRASVGEGVKRQAVEIYDRGRFFTMTGDVYRNAPIVDATPQVTELLGLIRKSQAQPLTHEIGDRPQTASDEAVYNVACASANGQKFVALWNNELWDYPSASEADYALIDILQYHSGNRGQIYNLFMASARGPALVGRKKHATKLITSMINKSFDREAPAVNLDVLKAMMQDARYSSMADVPEEPLKGAPQVEDNPYRPPPDPSSLINTVAQFIYDAAPRQVPEIALAGAIGFLAGITGGSFNVSGTGLNQFVILVAKTGTGKEAMASGIDRLRSALRQRMIGVDNFVGPSEIASGPALLKAFKNAPSMYCLLGEYGKRLGEMSSPNASGPLVNLQRAILDLYNKSGQGRVLGSMAYSDKANNVAAALNPSLSLLCETTGETLYASLSEAMLNDGLLPRFTIIEYTGDRKAHNYNGASAQPHDGLLNHLGSLISTCLMAQQSGAVTDVPLDEGAQRESDAFNRFCDAEINRCTVEAFRALWTRAWLKALKLAALDAVAVNHLAPVITGPQFLWAKAIIVHDVMSILSRFERGETGKGDSTQRERMKAIARVLCKYMFDEQWARNWEHFGTKAMHDHGIISQSFILNRTARHACFTEKYATPAKLVEGTVQTYLDWALIEKVNTNDPAFVNAFGKITRVLYRLNPGVEAKLRELCH